MSKSQSTETELMSACTRKYEEYLAARVKRLGLSGDKFVEADGECFRLEGELRDLERKYCWTVNGA